MKTSKIILLLAFFISTLTAIFAEKANVLYVEGNSRIKSSEGTLRTADFGSTVTYGESVITGTDGTVEMSLPNGSTIRVSPNSVFSYESTGTGVKTTPVFATTAGRVSYKLKKATGNAPIIQTNSMVAGVRGTEFTVFAGRDGSVLLAVTDGIVDVSSQGTTVSLYKDEAVEVTPGSAPGTKYTWIGKELDFSSWNTQKNDDFLQDPLYAVEKVADQLSHYQKEMTDLRKPYEEATLAWKAATENYRTIVASADTEAIKKFQNEVLFPAQDQRAALILNIRYYALNYLSVRRFVLANMYMEMKSRYPVVRSEMVNDFFKHHAEILKLYEDVVVPELNTNDY